ncbi:hypothetical protein [Sphingomonas sp. UV9]|uniref:hypothetical protein n=1 Tax=Sphingomonas sp. UV9 TaxID=1851410 RepID=UPI001F0B73D1|nr:hypothetical protein [Sphingomonas sp. UV9]
MIEIGQFGFPLGAGVEGFRRQAPGLCLIFQKERCNDIVTQHLACEARQDACVEFVLADRQPVVAPGGALFGGALAAEPGLARFRIARAAAAAGHLAGQQIPRALLREERQADHLGTRFRCAGEHSLAGFDPVPQFGGHDAERRGLDVIGSLVFRIDEGVAFSRFRVLAIRLLAVRPSAYIQRIVEDAGTACGIAGQRVRGPCRGLAERMSACFAATR